MSALPAIGPGTPFIATNNVVLREFPVTRGDRHGGVDRIWWARLPGTDEKQVYWLRLRGAVLSCMCLGKIAPADRSCGHIVAGHQLLEKERRYAGRAT